MLYDANTIILEKYRVQRLLGRGGFAEVYLVRHLPLGVDRAIKVISKDLPGVGSSTFGDYRARFAQEANLGAKLDHPSLVRVHDFFERPDLAVLEMEYAPGGSLTDVIAAARLQGQPLPLARCLAIARDMAEGLARLHAMDIIHRDLKPSNVLLDAAGHAKVSDLGLAQTPGGPSGREILGSSAQPHPGTPAYMSPEQRQTNDHLPPSADVYAFGSTLFELLTLRQVRNVPPGTHAATLRADVPPWLDDLLSRCLAVAPEERPWDGDAVVAALAEGQSGAAEARAATDAEDQRRVFESTERARRESEDKAAAERAAREVAERRAYEAETREAAERKQRREAEAKAAAERQAREAADVRQQAAERLADETDAEATRRDRERTKSDDAKGTKGPSISGPTVLGIIVVLASGLWGIGLLRDNMGNGEQDDANHAPAAEPTLGPGGPPASPVVIRRETNGSIDGMPDISWVDVPAGPFIMGSDDHNEDEKPQRTLDLPAFRISKYETTNAQYQAFVAAEDGYRNERWWNQPEKLARRDPDAGGPNWTGDDLPAETVSWYDAVAYTRWLTARLRDSGELEDGREVRLPTEEEWEKAARGTDGREYPWGNGYKSGFANIDEKNTGVGPAYLERTTPVGSYPHGASPFGALDMAGNVWEWTLTEYYSKDSTDITNDLPRVWRGGSWRYDTSGAHASSRQVRSPDSRYHNIGFRVVVAAPVSTIVVIRGRGAVPAR